jgi:putative NIF3 family GTP cyclohydrolase 1 type 2
MACRLRARNGQKIITGVTASQALLDEAVRQEADAVIVHHGYFWKNESAIIRGMKRNRLKTLLANDINLYGWHLPLDAHRNWAITSSWPRCWGSR